MATAPPLTRRAFLGSGLALGASWLAPAGLWAAPGTPPAHRVVVVLPAGAPGAASARRGAALAAEEARRTAELLGARVEVGFAAPGAPPTAPDTAILIGGLDPAGERALLAIARERRVAFLSLAPPASDPQGAKPLRVRYRPPGAAGCEDWHASLRKFGAEQLNRRFLERHGAPMDSLAWAGWMAVKIASETLLRHPAVPAAGLEAEMARMSFDGHKGAPLRFDPANRRLRQPVYRVGRKDPGGPVVVLAEIAPPED